MAKNRKRKNDSKRLLWIILFIIVAFAVSEYNESQNRTEPDDSKLNIELAVPQFTKSTKSQVIEHTGYTVSYNEQHRNANWVAYELTAAEVEGTEPRESKFTTDPQVIGRQATDDDYKHSGWDRGHLAPAADMKWNEQVMKESFYLSNVSPQNHNLNSGVWKSIEEFTRDIASEHGKVLVVTGPVFTTKKGLGQIGDNRVLIPNAFFKVLLIHDGDYSAIGFYCENAAGKKKLSSYTRSIDEIEEITGIDFFHLLPDDVETAVESSHNPAEWGIK